MRFAACVLAAGASRRMGAPKAWLDAGGRPFVVRLLETFRAAGVDRRFVVAAFADPALQSVCADAAATLLLNPDPERGMLSSLQTCVLALLGDRRQAPAADALFMIPVDCPRVRSETVERLMQEFDRTGAPLVIPAFAGRRGHPALFAARLFEELLQAPLEVGARAVVRAHAEDRLEVPVDDRGVLDDVDTPEDLGRLGL